MNLNAAFRSYSPVCHFNLGAAVFFNFFLGKSFSFYHTFDSRINLIPIFGYYPYLDIKYLFTITYYCEISSYQFILPQTKPSDSTGANTCCTWISTKLLVELGKWEKQSGYRYPDFDIEFFRSQFRRFGQDRPTGFRADDRS